MKLPLPQLFQGDLSHFLWCLITSLRKVSLTCFWTWPDSFTALHGVDVTSALKCHFFYFFCSYVWHSNILCNIRAYGSTYLLIDYKISESGLAETIHCSNITFLWTWWWWVTPWNKPFLGTPTRSHGCTVISLPGSSHRSHYALPSGRGLFPSFFQVVLLGCRQKNSMPAFNDYATSNVFNKVGKLDANPPKLS